MGCNMSSPTKLRRADQGGASQEIGLLARPALRPHFLCPTCARMCRRSRHLRNLRFDYNADGDTLSESVLERFKHKSFEDFQSDRAANQKSTCHLCSIIRSVIECYGNQREQESNPHTPLTLALVRSGVFGNVLWRIQLSLGDKKLDPCIEIASATCAFGSENF